MYKIPITFMAHGVYEGKPYSTMKALLLLSDDSGKIISGRLVKCSSDFTPPKPSDVLHDVYYDRYNRLTGYVLEGGEN